MCMIFLSVYYYKRNLTLLSRVEGSIPRSLQFISSCVRANDSTAALHHCLGSLRGLSLGQKSFSRYCNANDTSVCTESHGATHTLQHIHRSKTSPVFIWCSQMRPNYLQTPEIALIGEGLHSLTCASTFASRHIYNRCLQCLSTCNYRSKCSVRSYGWLSRVLVGIQTKSSPALKQWKVLRLWGRTGETRSRKAGLSTRSISLKAHQKPSHCSL